MCKGFNLSLKVEYKKIVDIEQEIEEVETFAGISQLIIPFSFAFNVNHTPDIYTGEELIPFREKNLKFKEILMNEFIND
jgi:methyl coenzyme M reductase subunit D